MSGFSTEFRAHLQEDCTTLCHCWHVVRRDGQAFGFTDHDRPLEVGGHGYEPQSGFTQTEARETLGMAVDAVDIEGALSSPVLEEADIVAGLFDGAEITTLLVNWRQPGQFAQIRKAVIGKITLADGRFVAELESVAASLDKPNGRNLRRECDARLGDGRCKVNLGAGPFNGAGTALSINAAGTVLVAGLDAFPAGWFSLGEATWTSGALAGRKSTVLDHRITMEGMLLAFAAHEAMPSPGDTFAIVAGCDKRFETCKAKFANPLNFRGFPHLPGNDAAYGYVADGLVFDGGALVP